MVEARQISVHPLARDRIAQAYPLAQIALRNCPPQAWDSYARRHLEGDGDNRTGILIADDSFGTILGLLVYQIAQMPALGLAFQAKTVLATDPFSSGRALVAGQLLDAEENGAQANGCAAAQVYLPIERGPRECEWWLALLTDRGYSRAGNVLSKALVARGIA